MTDRELARRRFDPAGKRFDAALAAAASWRVDADRYVGRRRRARIVHAERMDAIAARLVANA